jgi:hypothetical protein
LPPVAKDASGTLLYLARSEEGSVALEALPVDSNGSPEGLPVRSSANAFEGTVFPSPDGARLAIVGAWGSGMILDLDTGKSEPFSAGGYIERFFGWSADSQRILIGANGGPLWLADPFALDFIPVFVPGAGGIDSAAASPDGRTVVYSFQESIYSPVEV